MFARMSKPGDEGVPQDDVELKLRDMEVLNENMHAENTSFLDSFRASLAYKHVDQHLITFNDACRGHTIRHVKKEYERIKVLPDLSSALSRGLTVISTLLSILDEIEAAVKQTPAVERAKIPLSPRSEARRIAAAANAVTPTPTSPSTPPRLSPRSTTRTITHPDGTTITEETPPATTPMTEMTSRFGNPAFRTFMDHVLSRCDIWGEMLWKYQQGDITEMVNLITSMSPASLASAQQTSYHQQHHAHQHGDDDQHQHQHQHNNESKPIDPIIQLRTEMMSYLANSFGNQRRIDYGTGHELNFLCFLLSLTRVGILPPPETRLNDDTSTSTDVAPLTLGTLQVLLVFARYMQIVRLLQHRYWLEPAGSRGVWGLDDYCFLPFVFGSAQLIGHKNIRPRSVRYSEIVDAFAQDYLYLESIQFVLSVKTCSFAEHSPMLNDITVIKTWKQVNEGLLRMYHGEVLGKFAVIQHFIFSSLLPFSSTSARPPINIHEHTGPDLTKTFTSEELNHRSIPIPHAHPHKNAAGQIEIPCCSDSVRFPSALAARQSQQ